MIRLLILLFAGVILLPPGQQLISVRTSNDPDITPILDSPTGWFTDGGVTFIDQVGTCKPEKEKWAQIPPGGLLFQSMAFASERGGDLYRITAEGSSVGRWLYNTEVILSVSFFEGDKEIARKKKIGEWRSTGCGSDAISFTGKIPPGTTLLKLSIEHKDHTGWHLMLVDRFIVRVYDTSSYDRNDPR